MASTSVTTAGGVTIVTQIIPKDDFILQTGTAPVEQAPPPSAEATPIFNPSKVTLGSPTQTDKKVASPLQVEPQCLGIVQIFVGLLCVLFSLTSVYTGALIRYSPFGLGVFFVVSGSLAVAAGRRTSVRLVWTSLWFNVVSALLGLAGVIYVCLLLASTPPSETLCLFQTTPDISFDPDWLSQCSGKLWMLDSALYGLLGLLLVLLVLQVCVSITVCVLSGKVIKMNHRYTPIKVQTCDGQTLLDSAESERNLYVPSPR